MSLSAAIAAELPFLREQAESLMQDQFRVFSPSETVFDDQGLVVPALDAEGFEAATYDEQSPTVGKIQGGGSSSSSHFKGSGVNIGGVEREIVRGGLHIPIAAQHPAAGYYGIGWEYECISVGPLTDPTLLGSRWLVVAPAVGSLKTAQRLNVARLV